MENIVIHVQGGQVTGYDSTIPLKVLVRDYDTELYTPDQITHSADGDYHEVEL